MDANNSMLANTNSIQNMSDSFNKSKKSKKSNIKTPKINQI